MKQKRHYTKEFKLKAIELSNQRDTLKQAADELGIRSDLLGRWRKEFYDSYCPGKKNSMGALIVATRLKKVQSFRRKHQVKWLQ